MGRTKFGAHALLNLRRLEELVSHLYRVLLPCDLDPAYTRVGTAVAWSFFGAQVEAKIVAELLALPEAPYEY